MNPAALLDRISLDDEALSDAANLHPADLMGMAQGVTFVYTFDHRFFDASNFVYHDNILRDIPNLDWKNALLGRTGEIGSGHKVCVFYEVENDKLLLSCIKKLISEGHLTEYDILSLPPYSKPQYVSEFLKGTAKKRELTPAERHRMEVMRKLHLMQAGEKKKALASMGAMGQIPSSQKYGLPPGQKYWALSSENFSFKEWFDKHSPVV